MSALAHNVPDGWMLVPVKPTEEMKARVRENGGPQALAYALAAWPDMLASAPPAPPAESVEVDCQNCAGNGEIVTNWDRYLHSHPGDTGDEAVAECPCCDGTGKVSTAPAPPPEPAKAEVVEARKLLEKAVSALDYFADAVFNDNGDMTVTGVSFDPDKHILAYQVRRRILSALATPPTAPAAARSAAWKPTHRHVKSGRLERVIGEAEAQVSTGLHIVDIDAHGVCEAWSRQVADGDRLIVYEGAEGKLWARFSDEFNDGRFVALPLDQEA
ncbi:hypothetical protein V5F41_12555 [Xanthobacter autotrophicus]|uniref:hypothetical protein n=1 Tax=Xanthobacter autotrophicus TaxID=280 RepID=UPI0037267C56